MRQDAVKNGHQLEVAITTSTVTLAAYPDGLEGGRGATYVHITNSSNGKLAFTFDGSDPTDTSKVNNTWEKKFVIAKDDEFAGLVTLNGNQIKMVGELSGGTAMVEIGKM